LTAVVAKAARAFAEDLMAYLYSFFLSSFVGFSDVVLMSNLIYLRNCRQKVIVPVIS